MPTSSPKLGLLAPVGADFPSEYRTAIAQHATVLDDAFLSGAWTSLTAQGGLTGIGARARIEGDLVRLDGRILNGTGSGISGNAWAIPAGMTPTAQAYVFPPFVTGGTLIVDIPTSGAYAILGGPVPAGDTLSLVGLTYALS